MTTAPADAVAARGAAAAAQSGGVTVLAVGAAGVSAGV